MKYFFVEKYQAEFSIKAMCRVLRVARSGWYAWRLRRHQPGPRQQCRLICDAAVRKAFTEAKRRYGAPLLARELPEYNIKTIAASLRRQGLRAKASRKFSPVSYREHGLPVSENLLKQDFSASGPNQKWAGDITYLRTDDGTDGVRCTANGTLAAKTSGKCHRSHRPWWTVLLCGLSGVTEAIQYAWQHECKGLLL